MIPKIIHHYWTSRNDFSPKYHEWRKSWLRHNPDYTMMFWNMDNYPYDLMLPDARRIMKSDALYITKTDVVRWELLRLFGGIVIDSDMECRKNFDCFLDTDSFCAKSWLSNTYGNACIGGEKGLLLWKTLSIHSSIAILEKWELANSRKLYEVGSLVHVPFLASCSLILPREYFYPFSWEAVMKDDKKVLTADYPNAFAVHWWSGMHEDGWCKVLDKGAPPVPQFPKE